MTGSTSISVAISSFILAGGKSRRFGDNKALYSFRGKPLLIHATEKLEAHIRKPAIITKEPSLYRHLDYPVMEDTIEQQNPLAGIYTGLLRSNTNWNFFLACDMPLITTRVIKRLLDAVDSSPGHTEIIAPRTPQSVQPLAGLYHTSLVDVFLETAGQVNSVKDFIRSRNSLFINFKSDTPFTNVNTKKDLREIN